MSKLSRRKFLTSATTAIAGAGVLSQTANAYPEISSGKYRLSAYGPDGRKNPIPDDVTCFIDGWPFVFDWIDQIEGRGHGEYIDCDRNINCCTLAKSQFVTGKIDVFVGDRTFHDWLMLHNADAQAYWLGEYSEIIDHDITSHTAALAAGYAHVRAIERQTFASGITAKAKLQARSEAIKQIEEIMKIYEAEKKFSITINT